MIDKKQESLQDIALDFVNDRSETNYNRLYFRLKPGLKKMIQKYHTDPETIGDILAITLSKAYVYVDKYDTKWNFSTWVYKICQNECLMELRRQRATYSLDAMQEANMKISPMDNDDWTENPDYEYFDNSTEIAPEIVYREVLEEIEKLPSPYKEVLEDRVSRKLKYQEISETRDIKINTVRSRIHSAKKIVKNRWIAKKRKESQSSGPVKIKNVATIKIN
jgi:RNA polymerase sigma-70 factor (ECF subfamily)